MEGASTSEQLIGAARTNNDGLLASLLANKSPEQVAEIINTTADPVGNTLVHIAARYGAYQSLDFLLDQEGVEIDGKNRLAGNTPLHEAVEYARKPGSAQVGLAVVDLLIECGANVLEKNDANKRPIDIAQQGNIPDVVNALRGAQYAQELAQQAGADGAADGAADLGAEEVGEATESESE